MVASGMSLKLSDDALEVYRNLTMSLIANPNGAKYTLFRLYDDIKLTTSQKYYSELKYCSSPFDMAFVSSIVDSLKDKGLVDVLENGNKVQRYSITDYGLQMYKKLPHTHKVGVKFV